MKFIHTADIHLDSPLSGLAAYKDAPTDLLRSVTRDAFTRLVDIAIEESVDFMIIAGDLYDGGWKDYNTGHYFCREMGRLDKANIPVYLLFGNHDAESEMTKKLTLPDNVHQFSSRKAETFLMNELKVALHGRSYREAATMENLATGYPDPVMGWLNIGVLHTALEGSAAHANYAPCSLAELNAKSYDYWALGHVHEHSIVQQNPSWIVFPGNLQGRHIRETGPRGAILVIADDSGIQVVERILVDVLRWKSIEIDASDATSLDDVARKAGRAFSELISETSDNIHLCVRVIIKGRTTVHGALFGLESQLREEIIGQAAARGLDRLWVEKVKIETEPVTNIAEVASRADAIADLQAFLQEAPTNADFLAKLTEDLRPLVDRAPIELLRAVPELDAIRTGDMEQLVRSVSPGLLAYLATAD